MKDFSNSPGFLIKEVMRMMKRNLLRRIEPLGLTDAQAQAFLYLARNEGINQSCLADLLEVKPITLSRTIDRLAELDLVARRPDPNDRRAVQLVLTEAGHKTLDEVWAHAQKTREQAMAGLSDAEREAFIATLIHIKDNLSAAEADLQTKDHPEYA